jgi:hypothetical protein
MTAEDRLRDLLRSEASTINPAGDGLARIRERVARRRRARSWLLPSAAVATAAAAAAFVLLAPDDHKTQTLQPGGTPTPTSEPSASPGPADDGGMPLDRAAIWPFTSSSQLASWQSTYPYAENPLDVGRHFVADYLGLTGVDVSQTCVSCGVLQLKVGGTSVGEITLLRLGVGYASGHGTQVNTVVGVAGTDLTVTAPKAGAGVVSPTSVTGRITGVDEHVDLRLLDAAGVQVAHGGAQAGSAVPWSATLSWTRSDWTDGALVGVTRTMRDGSVNRVVAIPVSRATASPTASFAGLVDGHVSLFDSATGAPLRQLTYPPAGTRDVWASWSAGTLAWVRTHGASVCVDELDQLQGSTASTLLKSTTAHLASPVLSPDGGLLAWVEQPCDGSAPHVVVRGGGAPDRQLAVPANANLLDIRDDGALLVWQHDTAVTGGTLAVVPPGALTLDHAVTISPRSGCETGTAAGFDGQDVVLFEVCAGSGRFVRYDDTGQRGTAGPVVANLETPQAVRVRDGKVLVWQFGGDAYGAIALYANGSFTTLVDNNGCYSTGSVKGCVASPDW